MMKIRIMLSKVISFLEILQKNNNREWFHANKNQYDEAKTIFETFVNAFIHELAKSDETIRYVEAKDCIFRIFRDVRFGKDKSPYKTNMGAWITQAGRKSSGPGYYIHIQPGESFLSGGVYMPETNQLKKIRQEIFYNSAEFKAIMANKGFRKYFNGISDMDKQKLPPRDFPKDFPDIDLLKHKHYTLYHPLTSELLSSTDLPVYIMKVFEKMLPFNEFLRRAMQGG